MPRLNVNDGDWAKAPPVDEQELEESSSKNIANRELALKKASKKVSADKDSGSSSSSKEALPKKSSSSTEICEAFKNQPYEDHEEHLFVKLEKKIELPMQHLRSLQYSFINRPLFTYVWKRPFNLFNAFLLVLFIGTHTFLHCL